MAKKPFINKHGFVEYPFLHDTRKQKNWWFYNLMEDYLKRRKAIRQVIKPLNIIRGTGTPKTDSGWKDNLSRIAEAHPSSPLAQRYGKKSTKEIKTREVIKKHRRRRKGLK